VKLRYPAANASTHRRIDDLDLGLDGERHVLIASHTTHAYVCIYWLTIELVGRNSTGAIAFLVFIVFIIFVVAIASPTTADTSSRISRSI